jgi:glucose-6-phosphate 1-dehydrogenase
LFTRPDGLSATWKAVEPLLSGRSRPVAYEQGSWGPAKARKLAAPHRWLLGQ